MTPEDFERVRQLFHAAREMSPSRRSAFLEDTCTDRPELREEVEALLSPEHESALLDTTSPARALRANMERVLDSEQSEPLPHKVGPYPILEKLGEGGMGVVFLAQQEQPSRQVALKVLRSGVATRSTLRRFEYEASVLGQLDHPGIAQIFEAGSAELLHADGTSVPCHFFAMEYVRGEPLTSYADSRGLGVRKRLALIARICDAVHHAHQKGVIHRDLKPGNVLVDQRDQPKVLDFGVARATDSDIQTVTMQTEPGQIVGTMPYMSPEQVSGMPENVDIRSDVYALGVMAYELLTGRLPHDVRSMTIPQAVRAIEEEHVTPLSAIKKTLRGDVETIAAKALEKDKDRRYQSASDLGADIRRYLSDQPITARPATTLYQLRKFARRNKALVAAVAIAFVALSGALIRVTMERNRAQSAEKLAEQRRRDAERQTEILQVVNDFLHIDLLRAADPFDSQRRDVTVREVLDRSSVSIDDRFKNEAHQEAAIRATVGGIYQSLGEFETAEKHIKRAIDLHRLSLGEGHRDTLLAKNSLAVLYKYQGRFEEAEAIAHEAVETARRELGDDSPTALLCMSNLGTLYKDLGNIDDAERLLTETLERQRAVLGDEDSHTLNTMNNLSSVYFRQARREDVELLLRQTFELSARVLGEMHPDTLNTKANLAKALHDLGRLDEAVTLLEDALKRQETVMGEDHFATLHTAGSLALLYVELGRFNDAEALHLRTLEARRRTFGEHHPETLRSLVGLAACYRAQNRYAEAEPLLIEALDATRRNFGDDHPRTLATMSGLGRVYVRLERYEEAEPLFLAALKGFRSQLGPSHLRTLASVNDMAVLYKRLQRFEEAEKLLTESLEIKRQSLGEKHPNTLNTINNLANLYGQMGRHEESRKLHAKALALRSEVLGEEHPSTFNSMRNLAETYRLLEQYEDAEPLFRNATEGLRTTMGDDHGRTLEALEGLVAVLVQLERFSESEPLARELYERSSKTFGPLHARTQAAVELLIELNDRWGRPESAEQFRSLLAETPTD